MTAQLDTAKTPLGFRFVKFEKIHAIFENCSALMEQVIFIEYNLASLCRDW
jgi:hypothetical protein